MPRLRRTIRPGRLIHIVVRFLDHQHLLDSACERAEYLRRAELTLGASDWRVLSYCLMSTHVHLGAIAGSTPFGGISRALHCGYAAWLNPRRGRLGPIVASRPSTYEVSMTGAAALIAYHHNNPVRAGVVGSARACDWSSHRLYLGTATGRLVDVQLGLRLAGFDVTHTGRKEFEKYVQQHARDGTRFDPAEFRATRCELRSILGTGVEVSLPTLDRAGAVTSSELWSIHEPVADWRSRVHEVVALAARQQGISLAEVRSRSRRRAVAGARRIAVLCGRRLLGMPLHSIASYVSITPEAARQLENSATDQDRVSAARVAARIESMTSDRPRYRRQQADSEVDEPGSSPG